VVVVAKLDRLALDLLGIIDLDRQGSDLVKDNLPPRAIDEDRR
jgi:hypothetical protein